MRPHTRAWHVVALFPSASFNTENDYQLDKSVQSRHVDFCFQYHVKRRSLISEQVLQLIDNTTIKTNVTLE